MTLCHIYDVFSKCFRLTPTYAFTILIYACLLYYSWDGPNWPYNEQQTVDPNCVNNWYLNILYVNNIFKVNSEV